MGCFRRASDTTVVSRVFIILCGDKELHERAQNIADLGKLDLMAPGRRSHSMEAVIAALLKLSLLPQLLSCLILSALLLDRFDQLDSRAGGSESNAGCTLSTHSVSRS